MLFGGTPRMVHAGRSIAADVLSNIIRALMYLSHEPGLGEIDWRLGDETCLVRPAETTLSRSIR